MKKICILTLSAILSAALLAGCGCTKQDMGATSAPTVLPTNEEIWETTHATAPSTTPTTSATTANTTEATRETIDHGNGPLEDTTSPMESSGDNQARQGMVG